MLLSVTSPELRPVLGEAGEYLARNEGIAKKRRPGRMRLRLHSPRRSAVHRAADGTAGCNAVRLGDFVFRIVRHLEDADDGVDLQTIGSGQGGLVLFLCKNMAGWTFGKGALRFGGIVKGILHAAIAIVRA